MNRSTFGLWLLLLASCDSGVDPSFIERDARVTEVTIQILESFPVQVRAVVRGEHPDGCTEMDFVETRREGNEFQIHLTTIRPADAVCAQALVPFEEIVPLEVLGLPAGEYRVVANGVAATFNLEVDNVPPG